MRRIAIAIGLAGLCLFAGATPAMAEFKGKEGKAEEVGIGTQEITGGTVTCERGNGTWKLASGKVMDGFLHEASCTATIAGVKVATEIKPGCEGSLMETTFPQATVTLLNTCTISIPKLSCSIVLEPTGNKELSSVTLENRPEKESVLGKVNISGITYTTNCKGLTSGKTGKRKDEVIASPLQVS